MTIECTKALTGSQATFKKPQAPNMYNAIVHAKSLEVNADLPVGEKKRLQEIQSLAKVKQGPEGLCKDKQEEMRNLLLEHCEIKSSGVCFNNAAAAHDLMCTSDRIGRELDNLALRTGSYGCFFLTQGHINNLGAATWYGSDNSLNFWEDIQQSKTTFKTVVVSVQGPARLAFKYETAIVSLHGVKIVGWPTNIPFVNPSAIGIVTEIWQLRDAWRNGTCHWIKLTQSQLKAYRTELEARQNAGEVTRKKRKKTIRCRFTQKALTDHPEQEQGEQNTHHEQEDSHSESTHKCRDN
ncbi:hypothetical protein SERLA73DRAFT_156763 [Serpula lacrymans var. lacrymans S7.3]|uniref:Uncharacterized protein n=1 Tax=Serpula lacrymans var. lacrymans (strain S7.3) TaxID=936435 RepID=F8QFT2_SERL3|nr:hypothetical protein SERLA73DRAFT_156763 [Serpula lacrymans var. lacrymans S7.3]